MFKLIDLNGNEVRFKERLAFTADGTLILISKNEIKEIKREGKYFIKILEHGKTIPY